MCNNNLVYARRQAGPRMFFSPIHIPGLVIAASLARRGMQAWVHQVAARAAIGAARANPVKNYGTASNDQS